MACASDVMFAHSHCVVSKMTSIRPVFFTLVLAFLLFDEGFGASTENQNYGAVTATTHIEIFSSGPSCVNRGCELMTIAECGAAALKAGRDSSPYPADIYTGVITPGVYNTGKWGPGYPAQCIYMKSGYGNDYLTGMYNYNGNTGTPCMSHIQCICKCPNPTSAPTPAPTTAAPTRNPTTRMPTSTPTAAPTPAPTQTVCQKLKGEQKEKCGGESPVNKVIQKVQDAVDTSPQDPMVDLGKYKLSDLEKEQKEGTCGFAKSDPAYLATELVLKINKLSTLV